MRYIGTHLGGGLKNVQATIQKLNMNTIQWMPSAPMRWAAKDFLQEQVLDAYTAFSQTPVKKVLLNGVYLINLARGDSQLFHLSKLSLISYLNFQYEFEKLESADDTDMEILGVCFHPGSAIDLTAEQGLERVIYGINWVLENSKGGKLLIESTAGAGNIMGDTLEELAKMREGTDDKSRVGFVLDTQHMFASGYNWTENPDEIINNIDSTIGIKNIASFHLNDSMSDCGSHKDRHADLFEGKIGESLKYLINHDKLRDIPFIMETPALKGEDGVTSEYQKLLSATK